MAKWAQVHVLTIIETILGSFNDLILLHLRKSLYLITLVLAQHSTSHALSTRSRIIGHLVHATTSSILILAVALDTLHVKVASIEAIGQVIHIV